MTRRFHRPVPDPTSGLRFQDAHEIQHILRDKISDLGLSQQWKVKIMGYVTDHPAIVVWTDEGHRETTGSRMGVYFALLDSLNLAPHEKLTLQIRKVNPGIELHVVWMPTQAEAPGNPWDLPEPRAKPCTTPAAGAEWIFRYWGTYYLNPVSTR